MKYFLKNPTNTLVMLLMVLTIFACEEKDKGAEETQKFVQMVQFNNKAIPVTIFYHIVPGEDFGDATSLDSLAFTYNNTKQVHRLKPTELYYPIDDIGSFSPLEVDIDYNFDNHMDIGIVTSRGNTAQWKHVYIYDPKTKSYAFQEVLSEQPNVSTGNDSKKQTLYSHINGGHAGLIYESKEFKWENGKLTLTYEEKQDYDGDDANTYTRITRTLQNGKWIEKTKTLTGDNAIPGGEGKSSDYSKALQTHFPKGTLGEAGKIRPVEMFFQKVLKNGDSYPVVGKSKTKAAEDSFSGTLSINSSTAGGSCPSGETEIKGGYDLNEKKSNTSGHFVGSFTACEKNGKLSKASFKGDWVKHANGNKTPCSFGI